MSGTLYLVATPIGNLEDMSFRAIRILKEVDLIACEDTRTSKPLLMHFEIKTTTTSYHEFNKIEKGEELIGLLLNGKNIAVIADAGTPGISDPGEELVKMAYENNIEVFSIPGPAAFVNAAVSSGQNCRRIAFEAFLPKEKKERERVLSEIKNETRTIVIYEAPHHLIATLKELQQVLGDDRSITLCRELTKKFEEKIRFTIGKAVEYFIGENSEINAVSSDSRNNEEGSNAENINEKDTIAIKNTLSEKHSPRGEYVLVIAGKSKEECEEEQKAKWEDMSIKDHVEMYMAKGMSKKDAMKEVAKDRGVSKRDIYSALLDED